MLTIDILEKKYADKIILKNINLTIDNFGIYGIVGKNGQGKTTLFKCLTGLDKYLGKALFKNNKLSLQNVAWCPTEPQIYDDLTANEFYDFYKNLLDLKNEKSTPLFNVPNDKLIKEFSTGMKKKTYLNAVLQKKHSIYIFDEPFNGLDLESNYVLMNYIREISKTSIVFISSHILELLFKDCISIFLIKNTEVKLYQKNQFVEIEAELFNN